RRSLLRRLGPPPEDRRGDAPMTSPMRVLDTGLVSTRRNIAITAALAELHRAGLVSDTLRFAAYPTSVLLGCRQRPADVIRIKACRRRHTDVARRATDGGAFYVDAGVLVWDLMAERHRFAGGRGDIRDCICSGFAAGLARFGLPVRCHPLAGIAIGGRTIAEAGGSFDGPNVVFQGTVLIDIDLAGMAAVLRQPRRRNGEEVRASPGERVTSLSEWLGRIPSMHELKSLLMAGLSQAWRCEFRPDGLSAAE